MIRLRRLSFAYPGSRAVLHDVDCDLPAGALVVLAGANGSGKSTLLGLLAGLFLPDGGELDVFGHTSPGAEEDIRALARLVHQDADLQILGATVEEDLLLGRDVRDVALVERCRALARGFGLEGEWTSPVQNLSWGRKRKLCLAAALADAPRLLLLDEPFSGLDYPAMREMRRTLTHNRESGLTQVVSSHDLEPLADIADLVLLLDGGRMAAFGTPAEVMDVLPAHGVRTPCSWRAGLGLAPWE